MTGSDAHGGHSTADGMVETALEHVRILEKLDYRQSLVDAHAEGIRRHHDLNAVVRKIVQARFDQKDADRL